MMKIFISDAVVSRGYDGAPAIRLFNSENGGEFAVFQVGIRKYDSRAENNHRWVNLKVKAFGDLCERIKKNPYRVDSLNGTWEAGSAESVAGNEAWSRKAKSV